MIQHQRSQDFERLFVFGGAYGNLQATEAILQKASDLGFQSRQIIFTGDMVAYCANPQETADLIRSSGIKIVAGNCEVSLSADAEDCGCGFDEGSTCSILSDEWYRFCRENLTMETRSWMGTLPTSLKVQIGKYQLLVCHGTPDIINQFVFRSDIEEKKSSALKVEGIDGVICGHSGIPFIATINDFAWINSGASGMPANDGTSRIWYAVIEADDDGLGARTFALDYDFQSAADAMQRVGLINGYRDCLSSGLWPSLDVLPEKEKAETGIPLEPQTMTVSGNINLAVA